MPTNSTFKRLPARRWGMIRRASLWDAGEYLLSISGTTFSERYYRFYYRDIRAIVVQKGGRLGSAGVLVFLASSTLFLSLLAAAPNVPRIVEWLWLAPIIGLAFILILSLTGGRRVSVYTAVSSHELPALFRRGAVHRVLPLILQKVREAQGEFDPAFAADAVEAPSETVESVPLPPRQTLYTAASFFMLTFGSAAFAFWYSDVSLTPRLLVAAKVIFSVLNPLEVLSGILALMKLFRVKVLAVVRACVLAGLGLMAVRSYALLLILVQLNVRQGSLVDTMPAIRLRHWLGTSDCALDVAIAITGLVSLMMTWQDEREGPVSNL